MGGAMKYLGLWSSGLRNFFEKLVKPFSNPLPPSPYILNVRSLNVPEDDIECESFTVISIDSFLYTKTNIT